MHDTVFLSLPVMQSCLAELSVVFFQFYNACFCCVVFFCFFWLLDIVKFIVFEFNSRFNSNFSLLGRS